MASKIEQGSVSDPKSYSNDYWDKTKYREKGLEIMRRGCSSDRGRRFRISRTWDYYYGDAESEAYDNLLTLHESTVGGSSSVSSNRAPDSSAGGATSMAGNRGNTPFARINFNSVRPKIDLLRGELLARGFEINVESTNKRAISEKLTKKEEMNFKMKMRPILENAAEVSGVAFGLDEEVPVDQAALKTFMNDWKSLNELSIEAACRYNTNLYKYLDKRTAAYLDLLVTNEVHYKCEIINGYPQFRRINGMNAIIDQASSDDYLTDQAFFGEAYYMDIPTALERWNVPQDDMHDLIKRHREDTYDGWTGVNTSLNGGMAYTAFRPFEEGSNTWSDTLYSRVLVFEAEFLDTEMHTVKVTYDKHGNEHVHEYFGKAKGAKLTTKEKKDKRNSIKRKPRQVVRKVVMLGGGLVVDYGKIGNYIRPIDNPSITSLNYVSCINSYNNGRSKGLVDRMSQLQDFKNYVLTKMQLEITTHIGGAVSIDRSEIPTDIYGSGSDTINNLLHELKAHKVIITDSSLNEELSTAKPISALTIDQSAMIRNSLEVVAWIDSELDKETGINEVRQGQAGPKTLVGVQNRQLAQQSLITENLFDTFRGWEERLWEKHIGQIKITWPHNPDKFDVVLGKEGMRVMAAEVDVELDDYGVRVYTQPMSREELKVTAQAALSQGGLDYADYLEIMYESISSVKTAILKFIEKRRAKEEAAMAQQQAQQEQAIAAQQQAQAAQSQEKLQIANMKGMGQTEAASIVANAQQEVARINNEGKIRKEMLQGSKDRIDNAIRETEDAG